MKLFNEGDAGMNEPTPHSAAKVHVVKPAPPPGESESRSEPLHIEYSSTKVVADALLRLQATHGVVREKTPKGKGFRFKVDIWADNEAGEKKTVGWVEVDVGV